MFSKILVEDYGYPKECIQTRPQFRVKVRPSDIRKEYPVDIAVFSSEEKTDETLSIIVECKKKDRKDGRTQLEDYLRLSKAYLGVWFNGNERLYLHKIEKNGKVIFEDIPNIPKYNQRIEDIGKYSRKNLTPTYNLKTTFNSIRNYLVGNATGTNRDEIIAQQLINLIFCKIYDERFTAPDEAVTFRYGIDENTQIVKNRIDELFEKVKSKYSEVIDITDKITLEESDLCYIVGELQNFCLIESERDVVGEAFETFIPDALKGGEGQFFTPRNVVKLMVEIINPQPNELVIDPACGTGGFLIESLRYLWGVLDKQAEIYKWSNIALQEEKTSVAIKCIRGIEKDDFLSKVAKAYMAILGDGKGGLFCEDSLKMPNEWKAATQQSIRLNSFDVLLTNPPFGKDIKVKGIEKLSQYDLAYKWKKEGKHFVKTSELKSEETVQILFIERSLKLLRQGGRLGIILPETFFHAPKMRYILQYLTEGNNVKCVIDLPHNTFRPYCNAKCIAIILEKGVPQQEEVKMAVAEEIGHDHNGKLLFRWDYSKRCAIKTEVWDDIPIILKELSQKEDSKYTFDINSKIIYEKQIFVPRYYWKNKIKNIQNIATENGLYLVPISTLIKENIIKFFDGHGSPPSEYKGKGDIPYIRVKDIVNWEVYKDPTSKITADIYNSFTSRDIQTYDIVYVRRGSYRIGSVAMISPFDTNSLYTRELLFIRVTSPNKYGITPYYLLYLLSHDLITAQAKNKVLIETTLPNIADRWKELYLPVHKDSKIIEDISERIKVIIESKWKAIKDIDSLKEELGNFNT